MDSFPLHKMAQDGNVVEMRRLLASGSTRHAPDINQVDDRGYTPLIRAVEQPDANIEMVRLLLEHGADVRKEYRQGNYPSMSVMRFAIRGGNLEIVKLLQEHGADIHYLTDSGYGALVDAVYGREMFPDDRLIGLLQLLVANGVQLNEVTKYGESGLRVLSRLGRFDAVKVLLEAGADASQLQWTPLMRAIAIGSLTEVEEEIGTGTSLEEKDYWDRTAWLLALQAGDVAKATLLYDKGANTGAKGRCGKPSLFYAIESRRPPLVRWLLEIGAAIDEMDEFRHTPLMTAVEENNLPAVDQLLAAGADLHYELNGETALSLIRSPEIGHRLLAAGADPRHLTYQCQRVMLGLRSGSSGSYPEISIEDFRRGRSRRFGTTNPEHFQDRFCEIMIRSGLSGYQASSFFDKSDESVESPVWCAQRFGQSMTFLPDKRIIQIGGEHEDSYDPDFCIYNDVFVHHPDGMIELFGYPEEVFPPTDFHTANLSEDGWIWIIGSLGYSGARRYGKTPVHRLNTRTMQMEEVETTGENPGWIYKHTTLTVSSRELRVSGGLVATFLGGKEIHSPNGDVFVLDTEQRKWRSCR
jgi:ankyrin repeat protein